MVVNKISDRQLPNKENVTTYKEYRKLVKAILAEKAYHLLKNEDVISDLITEAALADCRWDSTKGTTQTTWRYLTILYYLKKYRKNMKTYSLNAKNSFDLEMIDLIPSGESTPINKLISEEENSSLGSILDKANLSKRERKFIEMKYLGEIPVSKIAEVHGISEKRVYQILNATIQKLKCLKN